MSSIRRKGMYDNFKKVGPAWLAIGVGVLLLIIAIIVFAAQSMSGTLTNNQLTTELALPNEQKVELDIVSDKSTKSLEGSVPITEINNSSSVQTSQQKVEQPTMDVKVQVNGENVVVPGNGSVHKEVRTDDGNMTVDISTQSNTSSGSSSSSTMNIDVDSSTRTRIR